MRTGNGSGSQIGEKTEIALISIAVVGFLLSGSGSLKGTCTDFSRLRDGGERAYG